MVTTSNKDIEKEIIEIARLINQEIEEHKNEMLTIHTCPQPVIADYLRYTNR